MKKMKKYWSIVLLCVLICASFAISTVGQAETPSSIKTEKVYVSDFNNYNDISPCSSGTGTRLSVNKNKDYIVSGKGSMKIENFSNTGNVGVSMYASSSASDYTTFSKIEAFNLSVYNPQPFTVKFKFSASALTGTLASKSFELNPSGWTKVSLVQNRLQTYESNSSIHSYSFSFDSEAQEEIIYYLDDFYIIVSDDNPIIPQKTRKDNEVLNFDELNDLNLISFSSLATKGRTLNNLSLNMIDEYAKDGKSLKLDVVKNGVNVSQADVWTDGTVPYYAEKVGFSITETYLKSIDFSNMNTLKLDLFHTYGAKRKFHLTITDRDANSATIVQNVESDVWTTLEITDFARVNKSSIVSITFYYEAYQTFNSYAIYVDNIVIA